MVLSDMFKVFTFVLGFVCALSFSYGDDVGIFMVRCVCEDY